MMVPEPVRRHRDASDLLPPGILGPRGIVLGVARDDRRDEPEAHLRLAPSIPRGGGDRRRRGLRGLPARRAVSRHAARLARRQPPGTGGTRPARRRLASRGVRLPAHLAAPPPRRGLRRSALAARVRWP